MKAKCWCVAVILSLLAGLNMWTPPDDGRRTELTDPDPIPVDPPPEEVDEPVKYFYMKKEFDTNLTISYPSLGPPITSYEDSKGDKYHCSGALTYVSTDGGDTWAKVDDNADSGQCDSVNNVWEDSGTLYFATQRADGDEYFTTVDSGANFVSIGTPDAGNNKGKDFFKLGTKFYAMHWDQGGEQIAFYEYDAGWGASIDATGANSADGVITGDVIGGEYYFAYELNNAVLTIAKFDGTTITTVATPTYKRIDFGDPVSRIFIYDANIMFLLAISGGNYVGLGTTDGWTTTTEFANFGTTAAPSLVPSRFWSNFSNIIGASYGGVIYFVHPRKLAISKIADISGDISSMLGVFDSSVLVDIDNGAPANIDFYSLQDDTQDVVMAADMTGPGINGRSFRRLEIQTESQYAEGGADERFTFGQLVILADEKWIASGIYPATYDFNDATVGAAMPTGFVKSEGGTTTAELAGSEDGHQKIIKLIDNDGANQIVVTQTFTAGAQSSGTYEFWFNGAVTNSVISIYASSAGGIECAIDLQSDNDIIVYVPGSTDVGDYVDDTWHLFRVDFDSSGSGTWSLYVDGVLLLDEGAFLTGGNPLTFIEFKTQNATTGCIYYIDSLGLSWDTDYTLGDNRNTHESFYGFVTDWEQDDFGFHRIFLEGFSRELFYKDVDEQWAANEYANNMLRDIIDNNMSNTYYDSRSIPVDTGNQFTYETAKNSAVADMTLIVTEEAKLIYTEPDGKVVIADGSLVAIRDFDDTTGDLLDIQQRKTKYRVNRIIAYGRTLSTGPLKVIVQNTDDRITFGETVDLIIREPDFEDYVELLAYATNLLARYKDSLNFYTIEVVNGGIFHPGETINIAYSPWGLTTTKVIITEIKKGDLLADIMTYEVSVGIVEEYTKTDTESITQAQHRPGEAEVTSDPSGSKRDPESIEDLRAGIHRQDLTFVGSGAGIVYGEIHYHGAADTIALTTNTWAQITSFDTNGVSNQATPDHTSDHITIDVTGDYEITCVIEAESAVGGASTYHFTVAINGGPVAGSVLDQIHNHWTSTGGGGDNHPITLYGQHALTATDTLEVWVQNTTAGDRDVDIHLIVLGIKQLGVT